MTRRLFIKLFPLLFSTRLWARGKRPNTLKYLLTHKPKPFKLGEEVIYRRSIKGLRVVVKETEKTDSEILQRIIELHLYYWKRFEWRSDQRMHGVKDDIRLPKKMSNFFRKEFYQDDCDGWTVLLVDRLAAEGIQADSIICRNEVDESHMVASWKGYIIDQRQPGIVPRQDLNYKWIYSSPANGVNWKKIIN